MSGTTQSHYLLSLLQMVRPANVVTSISNVLTGAAISYYLVSQNNAVDFDILSLVLLLVISAHLYAGGIVFNDVLDHKLDAVERPERAIPSGRVSLKSAIILGSCCFLIAIVLSFLFDLKVTLLTITIALLCMTYNAWTKHNTLFGPINMGACRALNFLLGTTLFLSPFAPGNHTWVVHSIALCYLVYIGAITFISQEEVHAKHPRKLQVAGLLYVFISVFVVLVVIKTDMHIMYALPPLAFFLAYIFKPLFKALQLLSPRHIGLTVRAGVLGIVLFDATWVAASTHLAYGLLTMLLLYVSARLAAYFAVT